MVSCTMYDREQDYAEFYADTASELNKLPNLRDNGKDELQYMNKVSAGSLCLTQVGEAFTLTGNNTWEPFGN